MSRAERLLSLIEELRRHRRPVAGAKLAGSLGISIRTLYRDIDSLRAQGAAIEGEAGLGYVLRPGFMLPPLMFDDDEIEALVLGSRWVAVRADERLATAAANALTRIASVLPDDLARRLETSPLVVGPASSAADAGSDLSVVRRAMERERKLEITYRDGTGSETERLIWPFVVGFFDGAQLVSAWCELRQGIRHFRLDRISRLVETDIRYPRRRRELEREWREAERPDG